MFREKSLRNLTFMTEGIMIFKKAQKLLRLFSRGNPEKKGASTALVNPSQFAKTHHDNPMLSMFSFLSSLSVCTRTHTSTYQYEKMQR